MATCCCGTCEKIATRVLVDEDHEIITDLTEYHKKMAMAAYEYDSDISPEENSSSRINYINEAANDAITRFRSFFLFAICLLYCILISK